MKLARWGFREIALSVALYDAATLVFLGGAVLYEPWLAAGAAVPTGLLLFTLAFFRDPPRAVPEGPGLLVSPADGRVTHVEEVPDPGFVGERCLRISIFLSVFDVHLNRAPCAGRVAYRTYREGGFINAMSPDSGHLNEAMDLGLETEDPRLPRVLVRQIAGLIARRIVCDVADGQALARGETYGMIKFSSRTDLFLPLTAGVRATVRAGDTVRAGTTVVGELA